MVDRRTQLSNQLTSLLKGDYPQALALTGEKRYARQTLVEWARLTVKYSAWARAYHEQQKNRQRSHAAILRSLACKWLRILWRCWQDRLPSDEARYLARLQKRHPTLFALIPAAAPK